MTQEWAAHQHGAVVLPLVDATTNTLLKDADPALHALLGFLPAVLNLQFGDRLRAQAALEGGFVIANAVNQSSNVEPVPALYADRTRFPFFALFRKSETQTGHTLSYDKSVSELEFAYVLPALMPESQARLAPILRLVVRTIARAIKIGRHPGYEGGAQVLSNAGIMAARLVSARYERYERMNSAAGTNGEQFFRAVVGSIELIERDFDVAGAFEPFLGADLALSERDIDGNTTAVTEAATFSAPKITSVVPGSASKAGGTLVTLTGSGFRVGQPATVLFGSRAASAVTVLSPSLLQCVTPQIEASPTLIAEVRVQNFDGQEARLPAGFTFTTP